MGVLNVTPDSFSDGGRFSDRDAALRHARAHDRRGRGHHRRRRRIHAARRRTRVARRRARRASCRSSRRCARESPVFISVDTSKPEVMRAAVRRRRGHHQRRAGAARAGRARGRRADRRRRLPHAHAGRAAHHAGRAALRRRRRAKSRLSRGARRARAAPPASTPTRIAIDPGFGFGKTRRRQPRAAQTSRAPRQRSACRSRWACRANRCWRKLTGRAVDDRTAGSVALAAIAVLNGARIVRAHDVAATVDAIRVAAAVAQGENFDGT